MGCEVLKRKSKSKRKAGRRIKRKAELREVGRTEVLSAILQYAAARAGETLEPVPNARKWLAPVEEKTLPIQSRAAIARHRLMTWLTHRHSGYSLGLRWPVRTAVWCWLFLFGKQRRVMVGGRYRSGLLFRSGEARRSGRVFCEFMAKAEARRRAQNPDRERQCQRRFQEN
jgi:hypothetical protein